MQRIATLDTAKQQALARSVLIADMPTFGASLRRVIGIHSHDHTAVQDGFIGQHSMQLGKAPLRVHPVRLSRFDRNRLSAEAVLLPSSLAPFGAIAYAVQLLNADEGMRMLFYDVFGYRVIDLHFQPSLSSTYPPQPAGSGTSAFLLQAFAQACVMVGSGTNPFARMETSLPFVVGGHGKIAYTDIHADDLCVLLRRRVRSFYLYRDQQVKLFVRLVIPQMSSAYLGSIEKRLEVLFVAIVGNNDTTSQREDAHELAFLEAVVMPILVDQRGRNKLGSLVQTFKPLLGGACFALLQVLHELGPQAFVGCSNIAYHATGHLRRQFETGTNVGVGSLLQACMIAHLLVLESILRGEIERIAIGKLCGAKHLELLRSGLQFEFGSQRLFHVYSIVKEAYKDKYGEESTLRERAAIPPCLESAGHPCRDQVSKNTFQHLSYNRKERNKMSEWMQELFLPLYKYTNEDIQMRRIKLYKKPMRLALLPLLLFSALALLLVGCDNAGGTTSSPQGTVVTPGSSSTPAMAASASVVSSKPTLPLRAIRMLDTKNGWALTASSILKTADGGLHWKDVTPANAGINQFAMGQFMSTQYAWIAIGPASQQEGAGILMLRTTDSGISWQRSMINDPLVSIVDVPHFLNTKQGWMEISSTPGAGSAGSDIWHSNDGGQTWTKLSSNKSFSGLNLGYVTGISFKDEQLGIAAGNLGAGGDNTVPSIALTQNGGQSWQTKSLPHLLGGYVNPQNDSQPPVFFGNVVFLPVIIAVQNDHLLVLYRSNDSGLSWFQTSVVHIQAENTYVSDASHAWATDTQSGKLYSTSDGGEHWSPTSNTAYQLKALSFPDPQNGWGVTNNQLLQTADGGKTWQQISYTIQ
jgi:photosystem II stability/assembly factor-like uncharacterized protein